MTRPLIAALVAACCAALVHGQARASVKDGIFTAAQAQRGAGTYREACASCHGATLEGSGQAPPLAGADFAANWKDASVWELFDKMQTSMPADRPGQLSQDDDAAILAYILQANGLPAGSQELPPAEEMLKGIRFEAASATK